MEAWSDERNVQMEQARILSFPKRRAGKEDAT
jgi:hypothetical protein